MLFSNFSSESTFTCITFIAHHKKIKNIIFSIEMRWHHLVCCLATFPLQLHFHFHNSTPANWAPFVFIPFIIILKISAGLWCCFKTFQFLQRELASFGKVWPSAFGKARQACLSECNFSETNPCHTSTSQVGQGTWLGTPLRCISLNANGWQLPRSF